MLVMLCMLFSLTPATAFASESSTPVETPTTVSETKPLLWDYEPYGAGVALTRYLGNEVDVVVPSKIAVDGTDTPVLKLADGIFADNDTLNSVTLSKGVLEIGERAFYDCDSLVCILISEDLTTIGDEAFFSCDAFNSIIIYDAVTSIGDNAFGECPKLTVWCNENTAAYSYVTANGIKYEILNPAASPEIIVIDGVSYYIQNAKAYAIGYDGTTAEVVIPATVNGYPMTELRETFKDCSSVTKVTLPEGLTAIDERAFYDCYGLEEIVIPSTVTEIEEYAFYGCSRLKNIDFPDGLIKIADHAFMYSVFESIDLPEGLEYIGNQAFFNNNYLTNITVPGSVTYIGDYAFHACHGLTEATVCEGVTSISYDMFGYCTSLKKVSLPTTLKSIEGYAFRVCTSLESITLPEGLESISDYAFYDCSKLRILVIPKSVTSISTYNAFASNTVLAVYADSYGLTYAQENDYLYAVYDGTNLPEVCVEDGVVYFIYNNEAIAIGYEGDGGEVVIPATVNGYPVTELRNTFMDCNSVTKVTLPEGLTAIGERAFYECDGLEEIVIPSTVTEIEEYAFYSCSRLKNVDLPDGLIKIGDYAFMYSALESIDLPEGLEYIGHQAFFNNNCLTNITVPGSVTYIGDYAFHACHGLTEATVCEGVTSISYDMFGYCTSLKKVSLPTTLKSIEGYAFRVCTSLESITLPEGLESISDYAFYDCSKLRILVIPKSVTSISTYNAFASNTVLAVYADSYGLTYAQENDYLYAVYDGTNLPEVCVEDGVVYFIYNNEAIAIGYEGDGGEVVIPATVNGYPVTELRNTFMDCNSVTKVTLPEGLTAIGERAFYECDGLEEIVIPSTVTEIEEYAFYSCSRLKNVDLPDGLIKIGDYAFMYSALESIDLPEGLEYIGHQAFFNNNCLTNITVPGSVTYIGDYAFHACHGLTEATVCEGVTSISYDMFGYCTSLKKVSLPTTLKSIEGYAFRVCTSLESITLPEGLESISDYAFYDCSKLRILVIPESVTSISTYDAFASNTVLVVHNESYAHSYAVENDLLYFILRRTENPDIYYGTPIDGIVTTTEGYPVAGATVEIYYGDGVLKERVTTNLEGRYTFTYAEVGSYTIIAKGEGGVSASTAVKVMRMNVFSVFVSGDTSLTLKLSHKVSGTVNVTPAEITLADTKGNVISTVTSEDGTFSFDGVQNGHYVVSGKTLGGYAAEEITVFNKDLTDVHLHIEEAGVNLVGMTEIVGRDGSTYTKAWVDVTLYDSLGNFVASAKTDAEGKYTFTNLTLGSYFAVAKTTEMRPDKTYGYERSYELVGYAYVGEITEDGTYQVDKISLCEDSQGSTELAGKITAKGETQKCEVILSDIFGNEIAKFNTGNNGKYKFKGIADGFYTVTAYTPSRGMGYTSVLVLNGEVYGTLDIKVEKTDKVKDAEAAFFADVPELNTKDEAEAYRERIADEKRFYDGLSDKEKKQLSTDYVERLARYVELLAGYNAADSGVSLGGLVITGDELERGDEVSFVLGVEKQEKWEDNENGIETEQDYIHVTMKDKASGEIVEYYEITMTKVTNGTEKQITDVQKDTDSMGKFRITLDIPEEYRGYARYTLIHVHFGEVVVLADLDDNPDTITVEVDRFSTFALATSNEEVIDESVIAADCTHESFTAEVVPAPNCTEGGYTVHTCDSCGYSYTDTFTDPEHQYVDGSCVFCGKEAEQPEPEVQPEGPENDAEAETECKDHSKCEAGGFKRFFNAIANFFRRLLGFEEVCVCGERKK